jgi:uncharacterized protein
VDINIKEYMKSLLSDFYKANPKISRNILDKVWTGVEKKIDDEPPPRIALIGESGVGKSSTINALFNTGLDYSHTEACTKKETVINICLETIKGIKGELIVYDMPGLSESVGSRERNLLVYTKVLKHVDVALWILDAQYRPMESIQEYLRHEIKDIKASLVERMVFALNKVDLVYPGERAWHPLANLPSPEQEANIAGRINDVKNKILEVIPEWKGKIIGYSAIKRYHLPQLFSVMLDSVPKKRQWVVASRKALANYLELVDPRLLPEEPNAKLKYSAANSSPDDCENNISDEEFFQATKNKASLWAFLKKRS